RSARRGSRGSCRSPRAGPRGGAGAARPKARSAPDGPPGPPAPRPPFASPRPSSAEQAPMDLARGGRAVQRVEVEPGHAAGQQLATLHRRPLDPEPIGRLVVAVDAVELACELDREARVVDGGHAADARNTRDR